MPKLRLKSLILIALMLLLSACGGETSTFSLLQQEEEFQQSSVKVSQAIDILWVVDNSGSMRTSQENVATNFERFIERFTERNVDFRIAVGTTDAYRENLGVAGKSRFKDGIVNVDLDGDGFWDPDRSSGHYVLTPDLGAAELIDAFLINILQGVNGSGDERAFDSILALLNNPLNTGTDVTPEFLRKDAFLAVIIVSDEDDFSHTMANQSSWVTNINHPNIAPIAGYVSALDELTASSASQKNYSVSAMTILDEACRDDLNSDGFSRVLGTRYSELAALTNGFTGSLCGDFASTLAELGEEIVELASQFFLDRIPNVDTIVVKVNGNTVPRVDLNTGALSGGWEYNASSNSIVFKGDYIPPQNASISIDYDPIGAGV